MVKQGDFSTVLVEAEAKSTFKEHRAPDGKIYVEVEPDIEYFIPIASTANKVVLCILSVDGESLGYKTKLCPNRIQDEGLWSYACGKSTTKALKFCRAKVDKAGTSIEAPLFWTGEVKADFYDAIFHGRGEKQEFQCSWAGGDVGYVQGISDPTKDKGIKAAEGTVEEIKEYDEKNSEIYSPGALLKTIRLNYCSAVGLIRVGVLPEPPVWEYYRAKHPRERDDNACASRVTPKKIRFEGNVLVPPREVELFDLSND